MRREIARLRLRLGLAAAVTAALAAGLAGCGSQGGTAGQSTAAAAPAASGSDRQALARSPLAHSYMKVLTTLSRSQLCAALSSAEAARILGSVPAALYGRVPGDLGIYCRWSKPGAADATSDELYVGISAVIDWAGAQQVDKQVHATPAKVDGRLALTSAPLPARPWAQVDVALGGSGDPVAEYRAPTKAQALALAEAATPHILSMG